MSEVAIARRYARALYEEADQRGIAQEVGRDMESVRDTLVQSRELRLLLTNPTIPREKKGAILAALFSKRVGDLVMRFLQLVVSKGREASLQAVTGAYAALGDERMGIQEVRAQTATELSETEKVALVTALEHMTSKRVRLVTQVNPHLLGGVVVRVEDTVHDGSVRHRLSQLHERLQGGASLEI